MSCKEIIAFENLLEEYKHLSIVYDKLLDEAIAQQKTIERLEELLEESDKSRSYWVDKYYKLVDEIYG